MKNDVEDILYNKKIALEELKAPEEFESRLRSALSNRKKKHFNRDAAVAVLIAALILTYSFDAIAYYGKKLLGYDDVTFGSIKQLNEEGMGQEINKTCTFSDGTKVTLNGIMFDEKELVAFLKIEGKKSEFNTGNLDLNLKGVNPMRYSMKSGFGKDIDELTQIWNKTFDSPAFYEKWMSFDIEHSVNGKYENRSIKFTLDRSKAMKHIVKWNIDKEIIIGDVKVTFDTITASRLSTVVNVKLEGADESSRQALMERIKGVSRLSVEFDLIADGKKLQSVSGSMSASVDSINLENTSDGLPVDTNSIQISNIHLVDRRMVDKNTALTTETHDVKLADDLVVKNVYYEGENTCITVESKGTPIMGLFIDGKQADNIEPVLSAENESSTESIDKVFKFKGRGDNMMLTVKTMDYAEYSDQTIKITVD